MHLNTTHGDDMALYLLCRMYNKHAYVHTDRYGWSTLPFKTETPFAEIAAKCIVGHLVRCWKLEDWSYQVNLMRKKTSSESNEVKDKVRQSIDSTQVYNTEHRPATGYTCECCW